MSNLFITTFTNKQFHFLEPHPDEVCIADIAQALSMNCRYTGHVERFYSVAEHCSLMADYVYSGTGCEKSAFDALMHDASEAYLTDIARPIKPHLSNYHNLEAKAEAVIQAKFGCRPMDEYIKYIDTHMVGAEARQLFRVIPAWVSEYENFPIKLKCWDPEKAREEFMARFNTLHLQLVA